MRIERAAGWNRKQRKCEHCAELIFKDEPIVLLFAEVTEFPAIYRGIAFHDACAREHLEDVLRQL
jgi:hypothetical protein